MRFGHLALLLSLIATYSESANVLSPSLAIAEAESTSITTKASTTFFDRGVKSAVFRSQNYQMKHFYISKI